MKKILIVEDNQMNMIIFKDILISNGYHVLEAMDEKSGIELTKKEKPDLVLMDIRMKEKDSGVYALKEIRKESELQKTPIIALTAQAMSGDREYYLGLGFNDYCSKPIEINNFIELIHKNLRTSNE